MIEVYQQALSEVGYKARRFLQMVGEQGGLRAAKALLVSSKHHSKGLIRLFEAGRLDLSMEATILDEEWSELFSAKELSIARERLRHLNHI